jgi:CheY-like chemotaxis protein
VERAAQRVLSMVNLSLDLFRMEEGTYRLRAQAVDLGAIVQTVTRELQAHARSKQLRLVLDLPPEPIYAQGEELLCYSTLANLVKNALEASPDGGEVRVTLRPSINENGDAIALDIHNAGQIAPELRERFFEKYATHGKTGGTGLGAYSARLMARVQRGSLRMQSDEEGTALSLRLPMWHSTAPVRVAPGVITVRQPLQPEALPALSVLVVDDDEYNIVVLKSLLPSPPLSVRMAVNGRAALECVREGCPDIVFMDVEMPVMGGVEAVRSIRAMQAERGEPPSFIAAFSAHDDDATRAECLAAGFDVYLAKPASREEVFAVLRREDPATVGHRKPAEDGRVLIEPSLMSMVPAFLTSRRTLAQELATAAQQGERETVRVTAHKLAGSLAMYGFKDASRASLDLERAAPTEAIDELRARCSALEQMIAQAQPESRPV